MDTRTNLPLAQKPFLIDYILRSDGKMNVEQMHSFYEIMLCLSGEIKCLLNDEIVEINKTSLVLINRNCLHRLNAKNGVRYERFMIAFSREFLQELVAVYPYLLSCFGQHARVIELTNAQREQMINGFSQLKKLYEGDYGINALRIKLRLAELLLDMDDILKEMDGPTKADSINSKLEPVLTYISSHYEQRLNIEDIARNFYMSRSALCMQFSKSTGMTLYGYITGIRLSKARELLSCGMRVGEVCERCGFINQSNFTRSFKNHFGCSPKQYATAHIASEQ